MHGLELVSKLGRHDVILCVAHFLLLLASFVMIAASRPNLLIFMPDQQRGATVNPADPTLTPVLDRFAENATRFDNAFAPSPHCCPSRASFWTGSYPSRHGVWNNICVRNALTTGLARGVGLWSQNLADAGYELDWNGKWHVDRERGPEDFGFQVHTITAGARRHGQGAMGADWLDYKEQAVSRNTAAGASRAPGQILREGWGSYTHYGTSENPFGDADHVASACEVIRSRKQDAPWCHFIGTLGPHDPYFAPKRFLDQYDAHEVALPANFDDLMTDKPGLYRRTKRRFGQLTREEHIEALRHYRALCTYEDDLFGRVLGALESSGQTGNTVVIYCSDHGDYAGDHGLWCKGLPCFRGAYEIPLIIRWPGVTNGARSLQAFTSLVDLGPTILEIAGLKEDSAQLSGSSLVPWLSGQTPASWRDAVFTQSNGNELYGIQRSVMTANWKLVYNGFDEDELYDLRNDPGELRNLAREPALTDVQRQLYRRLWQFAFEQDDAVVNDYIATGLAEFGPALAFA